MARKITDGAPNVVDINTAKKPGRKPKAAAAPAPGQASDEERAPAFGHNQPTAADVRGWARKCIEADGKIDEQKLILKDLRGQKRDMRAEANGAGIVLKELDAAIDELKTEEVDLLEMQERLNFYRRALGVPVYVEGGSKKAKPKTTAEDEAAAWRKKGAQAGMLGKPRDLPEGIPGEHVQAYLAGWDEEQENIQRRSPLTAGAFIAPASGGADIRVGDPVVAPKVSNGHLIFNEAHFAAGTALKDANLKTLLPEHRASVDTVDRVLAIFGAQKRIIKEPDADLPGGFYLDDGVKADVSEPEPVGVPAEELA